MAQIWRNLFGITQALVLLTIAVTLFVFWFRNRRNTDETSARLDAIDLHAAIKRTPLPAAVNVGALKSDLPVWDENTPPNEVLGISIGADVETVEKSYRALLRRYHPDRFASRGPEYLARAHQVVLLLQKARDRMLVGKTTGRK